jgi:SSS family solute:Na+ symporter
MNTLFSSFDIGVIVVYFVLVLGIGFYFSRKERTSTEYFLAGRNVGWIAIGASLFATNISSEHFIGLAGSGASSGLAVGHFEWLACIIVLILGWVFVPFYLRSGVYTMPEFLERRYDSRSRWYLTTVSIIAYIITKVSVTLFAGAILLEQVMGWDVYTSSMVLVILTGAYTVMGGLYAVIYTELLQTFVLIGGAAVLTIFGLNEVGGISGLVAKVPASYFSIFKPMSDPNFPWTGIIFGAPILGIWYWCTDQFIVQRVLSAKNLNHARSGTILAGFLKILPVFILVLPGIIAVALYPDIRGDQAYPTLVARLLPAGLKGIVIASLLAALMSSLASCFNSSSTLLTLDIYKKFHPEASEKKLITVGRIITGIMVLLAMIWIPLIRVMGSQLYIYLQSVQAYISPPIAAAFLFGVFWKRVNGNGAIASMITGLVLGGARLVGELVHKSSPMSMGLFTTLIEMNFLHFAILLFVICSLVLIIVSLMTAKPDEKKISGLTFATTNKAMRLAETTSGKRMNIFFSVLLIATVLILWIVFR